MVKKFGFVMALAVGVSTVLFSQARAETKVTVHCDKDAGAVRELVYGNNLVAYDPATYEEEWNSAWAPFYDYRLFGAGIWDTLRDKPVSSVMRLIKEAGITALRFPGGCGVHHYDWKKTIDPFRTDFLFGLDEFMLVCERARAEAVITLSYHMGTPQDAADMVEYLNMPDNGAYTWARKRAEYGRKKPYGVTFFEVGNEVWHGDHRLVSQVTPEEYAARYLEYYAAIKAVDPTVKVGAVILDRLWAEDLLEIIGSKIDFAVMHLSPGPVGVSQKDMARMQGEDLFYMALANAVEIESQIVQDIGALLEEKAGKEVPFAVTEYNANFQQDNPVPYRHSLGAALVNAEMLRIFMKPENRVIMANYWNFINEYWGMAANGFDGREKSLSKRYYKRPSFFVYELYARHFGDILLDAEVEAPEYAIYDTRVPFISANASRSNDGHRVYVMLVNKEMRNALKVTVEIASARTAGVALVWTLQGEDVSSTNEEDHGAVKVSRQKVRVVRYPWSRKGVLELKLPPHSVTAVEVKKK